MNKTIKTLFIGIFSFAFLGGSIGITKAIVDSKENIIKNKNYSVDTTEKTYSLVKSVSSLTVGKRFVLVYNGEFSPKAISSSHLSVTSVTVSGETLTSRGDAIEFEVDTSSNSGYVTFRVSSDNYLTLANDKGLSFSTSKSGYRFVNMKASYVVDVETYKFDNYYLKYNPTTSRVQPYASSDSSTVSPKIYARDISYQDDINDVYPSLDVAFSYTKSSTGSYINQVFLLKANLDNNIESYFSKDRFVTGYGFKITKNDESPMYYSFLDNTYKSKIYADTFDKYILLNLGDILTNTSRITDLFTLEAYVTHNGVTYVSNLVTSESYASLVKDIYESDKLTPNLNIKDLYDAFALLGAYA